MAPAINPCRKALEYAQADATAAHVALMSTELGTSNPSSSRGERQALSVLLAARRSAVNASTEAQLQVFSLVIAAPEPIRVRSRGQKLAAMLNTAATLRVQSAWDVETTSTVVALRTLARVGGFRLSPPPEFNTHHYTQCEGLAPAELPRTGSPASPGRFSEGFSVFVQHRGVAVRSAVMAISVCLLGAACSDVKAPASKASAAVVSEAPSRPGEVGGSEPTPDVGSQEPSQQGLKGSCPSAADVSAAAGASVTLLASGDFACFYKADGLLASIHSFAQEGGGAEHQLGYKENRTDPRLPDEAVVIPYDGLACGVAVGYTLYEVTTAGPRDSCEVVVGLAIALIP